MKDTPICSRFATYNKKLDQQCGRLAIIQGRCKNHTEEAARMRNTRAAVPNPAAETFRGPARQAPSLLAIEDGNAAVSRQSIVWTRSVHRPGRLSHAQRSNA